MNGDLDAVLRGVRRSIDSLNRRVEKLEQQNRFTGATDWMAANWWGWASPTQPASKFVQLHSGVFWLWDQAGDTGAFRRMDDTVYDLVVASPFAAQYHYTWAVLRVDASSNPAAPELWESGAEFATAALCEEDFWTNGPAEDLWSGDHVPLAALVLRNDGNLGVAGAIENLTLADREQSYVLARDLRPWLHLHTT